jgi:23S rRNA pseudouridine1911/1915/1917 synthase
MKRPKEIESHWLALKFEVKREQAGRRADIFISNQIPRLSRTRVKQIIERAAYDSEGRPIKPNRTVREGDVITIYRPPPQEPEVPRHFDILYEDEWILGIDKPAGLPVHPTARYHLNTLTALLRDLYGENRPLLAHRIDAETSGVLLCAKTKESERRLKFMFAKRQIQKIYLAIVFGVPMPPFGRIEASIGPDTSGPVKVKMACRPDGMPSLTEYQVLQHGDRMSLVECVPRTGRQHQIRTHLAHIGHSIVGDKMYGKDPNLFIEYVEQGSTPDIHARAGAARHFLHASSVCFIHPMTDEPITIQSPLPEDMRDQLMNML